MAVNETNYAAAQSLAIKRKKGARLQLISVSASKLSVPSTGGFRGRGHGARARARARSSGVFCEEYMENLLTYRSRNISRLFLSPFFHALLLKISAL